MFKYTEVKFSLTCWDSQIALTRVIIEGILCIGSVGYFRHPKYNTITLSQVSWTTSIIHRSFPCGTLMSFCKVFTQYSSPVTHWAY